MKRSLPLLALAAAALTPAAIATAPALSAPNAAAAPAKIAVARSALGGILVDGRGRTLYLFEKDRHGTSTCGSGCTTYWPPLSTHGKPAAGHGVKASLLGVTHRADGTTQVTYAGHPLYRFVQDTRPGQTTGQDSQAFGAGWYVLSAAGRKIGK